jgi:hypothetical protein
MATVFRTRPRHRSVAAVLSAFIQLISPLIEPPFSLVSGDAVSLLNLSDQWVAFTLRKRHVE